MSITRFAVLPDSRKLLLGIDKAGLFEPGYVYEATAFDGEVVFTKIGEYCLAGDGFPNESSDVNDQVCSGYHLLTKEEAVAIKKSREERDEG